VVIRRAVSEGKHLQAKQKDVKSSRRSPSIALNEASGNDVMIDANCSGTEPIAR
jgi:hypothetical protein